MISEEEGKEKTFEEKVLDQMYKQRFTLMKVAKAALEKGDAHLAINNYNQLFDAVCHHIEIERFDLNPAHFTGPAGNSEKLLLSQAYYDMARLSDLKTDEKSKAEVSQYLNQFVKFSLNQPYQSLNTKMLNQHLKKTKFRNKAIFEATQKRIMTESRLCFIATYCFGEEHEITNYYRKIKLKIAKLWLGEKFISFYYNSSPQLIAIAKRNTLFSFFLKNMLFQPLLRFFYYSFKTR